MSNQGPSGPNGVPGGAPGGAPGANGATGATGPAGNPGGGIEPLVQAAAGGAPPMQYFAQPPTQQLQPAMPLQCKCCMSKFKSKESKTEPKF